MAIAVVNKSRSATKSGPGRVHAQGLKKARMPKKAAAGIGFVQHKADAAKKLRRDNVQALGRRQAIKAAKRERREALPEGLAA
jgi:ABC-type lipopolysaccharide export system ATPase subunit